MIVPGSANPLLLASAAEAGAYEIERSVRFNSADSAYLSRTPASAGNRKTWTWAGWVKRSALGAYQRFFAMFQGGVAQEYFRFESNDTLKIAVIAESKGFTTTQVFRDASAWYHIVVALDTPQATDSNRLKLYVNGAQVTAFSSTTYPTQDSSGEINNTYPHFISSGSSGEYFSGYLADIHFIDGQALTPSDFTETDATTGQLIPKAYTGTYGTNGFHLPFSDNSTAAALGTDTSGNGNNWTVHNIAVDNPTTLPAVAFDGSGDYLQIGSSADFAFGTGDYTAEFFIYPLAITNQRAIIDIGNGTWQIYSNSSGQITFYNGADRITSSAIANNIWYHIAITRSSNTTKLFINGQQGGSSYTDTTNYSGPYVFTVANRQDLALGELKAFISNLRIVKGTALYTSNFTPPTAPLTNVTNTKLLCCQSTTSATAATVSPGTITAGGDVYAATLPPSQPGNDSLVDTPTSYGTDTGAGGEVRGNYATWNPLSKGSSVTLTNGNLDWSTTGTSSVIAQSSIAMSSGKWYCELTATSTGNMFGVQRVAGAVSTSYLGLTSDGWGYYGPNGNKYNNGSNSSYGATYTTNDVIGIAFDADAGTLTFYKNGVSQGQAFSGLTNGPYSFALGNGLFGLSATANFGQRPFAYTAPSGYKALCTTNLPEPTIADGSTVMDVLLWTGTGTGADRTISGLAFANAPGFIWGKSRSSAYHHTLWDTVRGYGLTNVLSSDRTEAAGWAASGRIKTATPSSITWEADSGSLWYDGSSATYVAWAWDAGSSTVTNTQGSITSQVRANASAGFSIVTYTGPGPSNNTVGHGLGVAPELIITKNRDRSIYWIVYTKATGKDAFLRLNTTDASAASSNIWGTAAPTSTVFGGVGTDLSNGFTAGEKIVSYCFAPVAGYSAFGSYVGNGSADGPFVFTGFRPRYVLQKKTSDVSAWAIRDAARDPYNAATARLWTNFSSAESSADAIDLLSNGFKVRNTDTDWNANGATYIYAAFAESPFQYARAR